ncbi:MAG: D-aminoacylase [Acidobacteria bacterium]|nr:D-aminoacylase [Acidobacteriota bacterium]
MHADARRYKAFHLRLSAFICGFLWVSVVLGAAQYDLVIQNARVLDGTGNPWFRADIGIAGGKIVAVGKLEAAGAARVIDARERMVAPGFIDVHTHIEIEDGILERPEARNFITDGVTTVVTGNCGLSRTDVAKFFAELEAKGPAINVATLIGHNSVREAVMGTANRQPTAEEMDRMRALVEQAMRYGAVGFSTGLIYVPGTYSKSEEVVELAKTAARYGGVYASHMRDEGEKVLDAIAEALRVGREAHMPVELSHFKIDNQRLWGWSEKTLAAVEAARREGIDVVVDQYPYTSSSTNIGMLLPSWALADGPEQIRQRLTDPATKAKIIQEMEDRWAGRHGRKRLDWAHVAQCKWDPSLEGKTITQITQEKGRKVEWAEEFQTVFDILLGGGATMVYDSMGPQDVERILRYPNTAVASDAVGIPEFGVGVPHPRSYGTNTRVISKYVRELGVITLEEAVRKMTSLPARTFGFRDRGQVREGFWADLLIFDPARVADLATFEKPHQYSAGFDYVLVNGVPVIEEGRAGEARPGRVVRRASAN